MYDFNKYINKYTSRYETIINLYKRLFNSDTLSNDYITLCALQADDKKQLSKRSELYQLLNNNFLHPEQFYGIDKDNNTIKKNKQLGIGNWIHGDIHSYLEDNIEKITPSIINLDTLLYSKKKASNLLSNVLLLLTDNHINNNCLVTLNVLVNNPYHTSKASPKLIEDENNIFVDCISKNYSYEIAVTEGNWKFYDRSYLYSSTDSTVMRTYLFYKFAI